MRNTPIEVTYVMIQKGHPPTKCSQILMCNGFSGTAIADAFAHLISFETGLTATIGTTKTSRMSATVVSFDTNIIIEGTYTQIAGYGILLGSGVE